MEPEKFQSEQLTFDFGDSACQEPDPSAEVVDIDNENDLPGLPAQEDGESLSVSFPDEEEEPDDFPPAGDDTESSEEMIEDEEEEYHPAAVIVKETEGGVSEVLEVPPEVPVTEVAEKTAEEAEIPVKRKRELPCNHTNVKRAALAFLASLKPDALAGDVPTRYRKYVVDGAAFWTKPDRKGMPQVVKTAVIVTKMDRSFSPECANAAEIASILSAAKQEKAAIEETIRMTEPQLKDTDMLFGDTVRWDYSRTKNKGYKECLKRIGELEHTLFSGTRFDKLRKACVASEFYLAVPENSVLASEIAESWGLVYIMKDLSFRLVKEAAWTECPAQNLTQLALNVGRAALPSTLFAAGIVQDPESSAVKVSRLPRKRRS